jgi:hypothetical protein
MRKLITFLAALALLAVSAPAFGGSLGDFKESYQEKDDDSDDDEDEDSGWDDYDDPDCYDCTSSGSLDDALSGFMSPIFGYLPKDEFSLGRAPYHGRGVVPETSTLAYLENLPPVPRSNEYASAEEDYDPDTRHHQLTLRLNGLATTGVDAAGAELFAKLSSTYMPGIAMSYQYTGELESDETLSIGYLVYEPSIFIEHATLSWALGAVTLSDQSTLEEFGVTVGMALEIFPFEPTFLDLRANYHGFGQVRMVDARVGLGVFVTDQLGLELNMRHLNIVDGASLTMVGAGVRTYLGF